VNNDLQHEEQLFSEALAIEDGAEREAFVCRAAGDDVALREGVFRLLAAANQTGRYFNHLDHPESELNSEQRAGEQIGDQIGRYKLLEKIGEGGFGSVYVAGQEEPIRRRVALKIIKLGMDTKQVIARFEVERQALALMEHPNIAQVYDAGTTETGRPYFVMELVRGIPITEYCDQQKLSTRERLELFIPVCQAIQHAHQKGVIHRDVKPTNVLVTSNDGVPHPMVIDFGVAKAINQKLTEKTLYTNFAQMIGTPAYMSPEQAEMSRLDVDTRSDIYSLGALLYELLTGTQPFPEEVLRNAGWAEMQRIILEEEPPRPSTRLSTLTGDQRSSLSSKHREDPDRISLFLRRELDWIVMRCLEKDRSRRFGTANALARDVERYLNGEIPESTPPTWGYQFTKLARKHRKTFAVVAVLIVITSVAAVFSSLQWNKATRSEKEAREQARVAMEARAAAEAETLRARRNGYAPDMLNAGRLTFDDLQVTRARRILDTYLTDRGGADLIDWEWYYLYDQTETQAEIALGSTGSRAFECQFSPDGRILATGTIKGVVQIWNYADGRLLHSLPHGGQVHSMAFADNRYLWSSDEDGNLRLWDILTGEEMSKIEIGVYLIELETNAKNDVLVGVKGSRGNHECLIWDIERESITGEPAPRLNLRGSFPNPSPTGSVGGHEGGLSISPDGGRAAVGYTDGTIRVVNLATLKAELEWSAHSECLQNIEFSPDGRVIVSSSMYSTRDIRVWNAESGKLVKTLEGHLGRITGLGFLSDSNVLVSSAWDHTLRFWDMHSWKEIGRKRGGEPASMEIAPDGKTLVTVDEDILVWDSEPAKPKPFERTLPGNNNLFRFSPVKTQLACVTFKENEETTLYEVTLHEGDDLSDHRKIPELGNDVWDVAYSRDGRFLLALSKAFFRVWDLESDTLTAHVPLKKAEVLILVGFTARDRRVLFVSRSGEVQAWSTERWEQDPAWMAGTVRQRKLYTHGNEVAFHPATGLLALGDRDGGVAVYNVETRSLLHEFQPESSGGVHPAISPDGNLLAVGNETRGVTIFDLRTFEPRGKMFSRTVNSLTWTSSGERLVIGGGTGQHNTAASIWDVETHRELLKLHTRAAGMNRMEFSHDQQFLAGISMGKPTSGSIILWRIGQEGANGGKSQLP
jgi:serine/threonine protein kinase/WD40 repeat protein